MTDWSRLAGRIEGDVLPGRFDRGRYATDASFYQVVPQAVVVPASPDDVTATLDFARAEGVPVTGRGGGTSQAGQTVNRGVVIDYSRRLNAVRSLDVEGRRAVVEPGLVLDELNRQLKPHDLWFPGRRLDRLARDHRRHGGQQFLRRAVDPLRADARERRGDRRPSGRRQPHQVRPGTARGGAARRGGPAGARDARTRRARGGRDRGPLPQLLRRVGGYNIDALVPDGETNNLAHLLVGSEGTLALSETVELRLSPIPRNKAVGVCHFPTFRAAMEAVQHLVTLGPSAVELVDRTMIELGRRIPALAPSLDAFVRGDPDALLLVEFAEDDEIENRRRMKALTAMMGDLGFGWGAGGRREGGVLAAYDQSLQAKITEVRTQGLNIMMSMKSEGKPVSFVEDCAVALPDLPDFTDRLTRVFEKHGTTGTWYAHASVGLLHVRPILDLKDEAGVRALRAIAEEAFDIVAEYRGSHSGEHGDGIVRSEFHERMFGRRMVASFEAVKDRFDPDGVLNPGRIVRPPRMDDRGLFRYPPEYRRQPVEARLDWNAWPAGLHGAVEMCNNNGACRKLTGGAMCPSYRVTRAERDVTRGRANTLRLALSGQLGPDALASDEMAETLKLCVSCKACKRECPMAVDMAAMKVEVTAARVARNGLSLRDRLVGHLPRYAPWAARAAWLANLRDRVPGVARLTQRVAGLAADRPLPKWSHRPFRENEGDDNPNVILFADTFNRWFEPDHLRDAVAVLRAAGFRVGFAQPLGARPLCCGRTYLSVGDVDAARTEMARSVAAFRPDIDRGAWIVGLEPSCLLTFRDEAPRLLDDWSAEDGARVLLLEEFLARHKARLPLKPLARRVWLHGHCHQKAANVMGPVEDVLRAVPELDVQVIESSCCGMAGAFGYQAETADVSRAMAELSLLPAVRAAAPDDWIVADGTSCRHQIADGAGRRAVHVATVLRAACEGAA